METISFTSDGKQISAEMYKPSAPNGGAVVIAYGSDGFVDNQNGPWATMIRGYAHDLADKGFTAVVPDYFQRTGTKPGDITISDATLDDLDLAPGVTLPNFVINDPNNRIADGPPPFFAGSWTTPPGTFDDPGTYLVICKILPHFADAKMYAWVKVH